MKRASIATAIVICAIIRPAPCLGGGAEAVFRNASPGVVLIQDFEGHGSGVVLNRSGMILTNYHVVNTPLPLEVTAEVFRDGRKTTSTFKDVSVHLVHKEYDLAMVRVNLPPGVTMQPIPRATRLPATGSDCFVIGNPGGVQGEALRNSISTGIIGAAERVVEGKTYIQTTAPINPGNSGGALVNRQGQLIGVVTFIISDTEGIGFATPITEVKTDDFIPPRERRGDLQKAREYERIGRELYRRSHELEGEEREYALALAYIAFRLTVAEWPNDPAPYGNIGQIYVDLKEYETARHFVQRAVELDGGESPHYLRMLGLCWAQTGEFDNAKRIWKQGLLRQGEARTLSACAEDLAITAMNAPQFPAAAYYIKWSLALHPGHHERRPFRNNLYQQAVNQLDGAQANFIVNKTDDFSFEELARFTDGAVKVPERIDLTRPARGEEPAEPAPLPRLGPQDGALPAMTGDVTVVLKDGEQISGTVFRSRPQSVTIQLAGALRAVRWEQIERIEQEGRVLFPAADDAD